jgi:hypothetical protein
VRQKAYRVVSHAVMGDVNVSLSVMFNFFFSIALAMFIQLLIKQNEMFGNKAWNNFNVLLKRQSYAYYYTAV